MIQKRLRLRALYVRPSPVPRLKTTYLSIPSPSDMSYFLARINRITAVRCSRFSQGQRCPLLTSGLHCRRKIEMGSLNRRITCEAVRLYAVINEHGTSNAVAGGMHLHSLTPCVIACLGSNERQSKTTHHNGIASPEQLVGWKAEGAHAYMHTYIHTYIHMMLLFFSPAEFHTYH